jgi:hypothetical protein
MNNEEKINKLQEFAMSIINPLNDGVSDLDADYIERKALEFGLLEATVMDCPCSLDCMCQDLGINFPTTCNRLTSVLTGLR